MVCIYCAHKTQIINSRPQKRLNRTWRRRECLNCHAVFTTEEIVDLAGSIVIRRSNKAVEPFNRDKLFTSILQAVGHRKSSVSDASALTTTIIAKLVQTGTKASITPIILIEIAQQTLQNFDSAAAVQYVAYHKAN